MRIAGMGRLREGATKFAEGAKRIAQTPIPAYAIMGLGALQTYNTLTDPSQQYDIVGQSVGSALGGLAGLTAFKGTRYSPLAYAAASYAGGELGRRMLNIVPNTVTPAVQAPEIPEEGRGAPPGLVSTIAKTMVNHSHLPDEKAIEREITRLNNQSFYNAVTIQALEYAEQNRKFLEEARAARGSNTVATSLPAMPLMPPEAQVGY